MPAIFVTLFTKSTTVPPQPPWATGPCTPHSPASPTAASAAGGVKGFLSEYKWPLLIGGGAALLAASQAEKKDEKIEPTLLDKVNAVDPNAGIIPRLDPANFVAQTPQTQPSIFPGGQYIESPIFPKGGYISPTQTAQQQPFSGYDYTKIQFPTYGQQGIAAAAAGGCVRTSIPRYDGVSDMALIECPDEASGQAMEKLMGADSNVVSFKIL